MSNFPKKTGQIGVGAMGAETALKQKQLGHSLQLLDPSEDAINAVMNKASDIENGSLESSPDLPSFVKALPSPRVIQLLIPDKLVEGELAKLSTMLAKEDIVINHANSMPEESMSLHKKYEPYFNLISAPVSGGTYGARNGMSIMLSGEQKVVEFVQPFLRRLAAKVSSLSGLPYTDQDESSADICIGYFGNNAAAHYAKTLHNGCEYSIMEVLAEAADCLWYVGFSPGQISEYFYQLAESPYGGYLQTAIADTIGMIDPRDPNRQRYLIESVRGWARQKGTGFWTVLESFKLGSSGAMTAEAVAMRNLSTEWEERQLAAKLFGKLRLQNSGAAKDSDFPDQLRSAIIGSTLVAYAQTFKVLAKASEAVPEWDFDLALLARIWRGGCIIRSNFLHHVARGFDEEPDRTNILFQPEIGHWISMSYHNWTHALSKSLVWGIGTPSMLSAISYLQNLNSERLLSAAIVAMMRDHFGSHGFELAENPGLLWTIDWYSKVRQLTERQRIN